MNSASNYPEYRIDRAFVPGTMIYVARYGTKKQEAGPVVSASSKPVAPSLGEGTTPEFPWLSFGKTRSSQIVTDTKKINVEGIGNRGESSYLELSLATIRRIKFSTNWTVPETFELLFGSESQISNNNSPRIFIRNGQIKVWILGVIYDLTSETGLLQYEATGTLRLADSPTWQSDAITNNYELIIDKNDLNVMTPYNVQAGEWDLYSETSAPGFTHSPHPTPNN